MSNEFLNPEGIAKPAGYTHVVTTDAHKMVYISGQIGVDAEGKAKEGLRAQTVQVIQVVVEGLLPDAVAVQRRRLAERCANLGDGIGRCCHQATQRRSACAQ